VHTVYGNAYVPLSLVLHLAFWCLALCAYFSCSIVHRPFLSNSHCTTTAIAFAFLSFIASTYALAFALALAPAPALNPSGKSDRKLERLRATECIQPAPRALLKTMRVHTWRYRDFCFYNYSKNTNTKI
jgi:hypothetical protein